MNTDNTKHARLSEKLYGHLLWFYPKAHREDYGDSMAQVFRDQCRDAVRASPRLGVVRVWLRVLPDLITTSLAEHLSAMREKGFMQKGLLMSLFARSPRVSFLLTFVTVTVGVFLVSAIISSVMPKVYIGSARMMVRYMTGGRDIQESTLRSDLGDPLLIQAEATLMQSDEVLGKVVESLNLMAKWADAYNHGAALTKSEATDLLRRRVAVTVRGKSSVIDIHAESSDRQEAAVIANALIDAYRRYSLAQQFQKNQLSVTDHPITIPNGVILMSATPDASLTKKFGLQLGIVLGVSLGLVTGGWVAFLIRRQIRGNLNGAPQT